MKKMTIQTVRALVRDLKTEALAAGRYPSPHKAELWEQREKGKAFGCILYCRNRRQINALEDLITEAEKYIKKFGR